MARIIWTEPALQELDEIADYISLAKTGAGAITDFKQGLGAGVYTA